MSKSLAWLRYGWRRHGPVGLVQVAAYNLAHCIKIWTCGSRRADTFDLKYGTDTSGIREIRSLDILTSPPAPYAVRYGPSNAQFVRETLERLQIDYARFTFIDYGSGKGRVLLVAAGFPFNQVIGVEFSRELHETALQNIARVTPDVVKCGKVSSIHCDASSFEPPKSNLVCYFYNPFGPPVMTAVAARLSAQYDRFGSQIIIIYLDPRHNDVFEATGKFVVLDKTQNAVMLSTSVQELTLPLRGRQ